MELLVIYSSLSSTNPNSLLLQRTISKEIKRNAGLKSFKEFVKTITFDNDKEFAKHKDMADSLGCDTYFAKPYHSWERGQNEKANGLLQKSVFNCTVSYLTLRHG